WDKDNKIVLTKNEDYWDEGKPKLERVIFRVIDDNSARLNALKSGEIDLMDGTNPSDVESIEEDDDLEIYNRPPLSMAYLDRKSTRLNSSHVSSSYAVFCLK